MEIDSESSNYPWSSILKSVFYDILENLFYWLDGDKLYFSNILLYNSFQRWNKKSKEKWRNSIIYFFFRLKGILLIFDKLSMNINKIGYLEKISSKIVIKLTIKRILFRIILFFLKKLDLINQDRSIIFIFYYYEGRYFRLGHHRGWSSRYGHGLRS